MKIYQNSKFVATGHLRVSVTCASFAYHHNTTSRFGIAARCKSIVAAGPGILLPRMMKAMTELSKLLAWVFNDTGKRGFDIVCWGWLSACQRLSEISMVFGQR